MHVFSYLDVADRVSVSMVCKEWNQLVRSPKLWANVDVRQAVKESQRKQSRNISVRESEHRARTMKYLSYVCNINPFIHRLVLVGDIADAEFNERIQLFTKGSKLMELNEVTIDWTRSTKSEDQMMLLPEAFVPVDENHRRRQRLFVRFFEHLARAAPNLKSLTLPFDWSPKSVDAIIALPKLECVTLSRYSDLQTLDVVTMDRLISSMPELRNLTVEVWTPCASGGLTYFRIRSDSLEIVDLSQCRGLAVGEVRLPQVRELHISRRPWSGPLVVLTNISTSTAPPPPCLYRLLTRGAPSLVQLNEHVLRPDWRSETYSELEDILKFICPCELHCACTSLTEDVCM